MQRNKHIYVHSCVFSLVICVNGDEYSARTQLKQLHKSRKNTANTQNTYICTFVNIPVCVSLIRRC